MNEVPMIDSLTTLSSTSPTALAPTLGAAAQAPSQEVVTTQTLW